MSHTALEEAAAIRDREFGPRVFVRGVVEISNFCRENCGYCGMRRDHRDLKRFRLSPEEIFEHLMGTLPPEVTDLNIQAGEDPRSVGEIALPLLENLRRETRLGLSVSLGTLREADYRALRAAGARYYVIKLETGDAEHYRAIGAPGHLEERLGAIRHLAATGWHVSSGYILGLPGQTPAIREATVAHLQALDLAGCSVSPFVPGEATPFQGHPAASLESVIDAVAELRRLMPRRIIPAVSAMDLAGAGGYAQALRAGANLATINLTPPASREDYLIYRKNRAIMTLEKVLREIESADCEPSPTSMLDFLGEKAP